jgi:virginiamycin A acetyltransferase
MSSKKNHKRLEMRSKKLYNKREGNSIWLIGELLFFLYRIDRRIIRNFIRWLIFKLEKGMYFSITIRKIFLKYYGVEVGMYSGCGGFSPLIFRPNVKIGRFTTITDTARAFTANHPINTKSSHAFFFNPVLGVVTKYLINRTRLTIGNDVFIGHNVIILPSVNSIGDGAYIGAGSVVTKNAPPYSILVGNPAKIIGYRFSKKQIKYILNLKWWEKSLDELKMEIETFQFPFDNSNTIR